MPRRTCQLRIGDIPPGFPGHVARVADLEALGVSSSTVRYCCRAGGPWRRLLPGIVLLNNGAPTRDHHRRAALLYAGAGAVLTGLDALELHGMHRIRRPAGPVHVLIPTDRRRGGAGRVLVERTDRLPDPVPGEWPLAPVTRAVLDFARRCSDRNEVRAALAEVVQRKKCTPIELNIELNSGSRRGTALPREVLAEISDGVRSVAEAAARELVLQSGLPTPLWNPSLYDSTGRLLAMPDAWFDEVGLAWEIDSKEWHLSPEDYERTLDRHSAMTAKNILVMHTQPSKITHRPNEVLYELRRTYANARLRPRPAVRAVPADAPRPRN